MNPDKLKGLLGMAKRAGKLAVGFDSTVYAIKDGESELVFLAADASPRTEKECRFAANGSDIVVRCQTMDRAALALAIGAGKPVAVVAVCDAGFAGAIRSYCTETKEENSL